MYIQTNPGLGAYRRRGMGDTVVTDPVTGEQRVVTSKPITTVDVYANAPEVFYDYSGKVISGGRLLGASSDTWIAGISNMVVGIAGAAFAGLLFMKATR